MHRVAGIARGLCLGRKSPHPISSGCRSFSNSTLRRPWAIRVSCSAGNAVIKRTISTCFPKLGYRSFSSDSTNETKRKGSRIINSAKFLSVFMALSVLGGLNYFLVFRHLERVPQTGRWRTMNITPQIETQLGEEAYFSIVSQYRDAILPEYHPITCQVREVVRAILEANDLGVVVSATDAVPNPREDKHQKDQQWRLAVIQDDNIPNSTASNGGIVVFTGLLSICNNENELAAILGHEIAHVVARHLAERYSKAKDWSLQRLLFGPSRPKNQRHAEEEYKQMMLSNLHEQELEADAIGLQLSSKACFDPQAAISVNQRLAALEERFRRFRPEFKPSHPCSEERIKQLERLLPKAYGIMSKSPRCNQAV